MSRYFMLSITVCLLASSLALAEDAGATDAMKLIAQTMKSQFDQPDLPLAVDPIAMEGTFAMAGWSKGDTGGRALLRRVDGRWEIVLCAGDALLRSSTLTAAGVTPETAARLLARMRHMEAQLPGKYRALLSKFATIVRAQRAHP